MVFGFRHTIHTDIISPAAFHIQLVEEVRWFALLSEGRYRRGGIGLPGGKIPWYLGDPLEGAGNTLFYTFTSSACHLDTRVSYGVARGGGDAATPQLERGAET